MESVIKALKAKYEREEEKNKDLTQELAEMQEKFAKKEEELTAVAQASDALKETNVCSLLWPYFCFRVFVRSVWC